MRLALFQPDIPQNAGALVRLAACMDIAIDIVEPCGFVFGERLFHRAGMDYVDAARIVRHANWESFLKSCAGCRIVLLTVKAPTAYTEFGFRFDDVLLLGRESAGVTQDVHMQADAQIRIPMKTGLRSLNVAQAGAMVLGEALRQTKGFPA